MVVEAGPRWRDEAACLGLEQELFFPVNNEGHQVLSAKAACAGCPVQQPCLDWALRNGADFGIWGGLTPQERRDVSIRRRRRRG